MVEDLAGGMLVWQGRLGWRGVTGWGWFADGCDGLLVPVPEGEPVGPVGVTVDGELAAVQAVVVAVAEQAQVRCVGAAAVLPVDDVMDIQSEGGVTGRVTAAAVAVVDNDPGPGGHDVAGATDADRLPPLMPQRSGGCVTGHLRDQIRGQGGALVEPGAVVVEMDDDLVQVTPRRRRDCGQ